MQQLDIFTPIAPTHTTNHARGAPVATPSHDTARPIVADSVRNTAPDTVPDTMRHTAPDTVRNTVPVNVSQLAKQLGVSRSTVYRRIESGELSLNGAIGD